MEDVFLDPTLSRVPAEVLDQGDTCGFTLDQLGKQHPLLTVWVPKHVTEINLNHPWDISTW